jgi:hypothetical protein
LEDVGRGDGTQEEAEEVVEASLESLRGLRTGDTSLREAGIVNSLVALERCADQSVGAFRRVAPTIFRLAHEA